MYKKSILKGFPPHDNRACVEPPTFPKKKSEKGPLRFSFEEIGRLYTG